MSLGPSLPSPQSPQPFEVVQHDVQRRSNLLGHLLLPLSPQQLERPVQEVPVEDALRQRSGDEIVPDSAGSKARVRSAVRRQAHEVSFDRRRRTETEDAPEGPGVQARHVLHASHQLTLKELQSLESILWDRDDRRD